MRIRELWIRNYRSIVEVGPLRVTPMLSIVGANNCGKSNTLSAIKAFLTGGVGASIEDFKDSSEPIIIKITFSDLSEAERKRWKKYLVGEDLILEKQISAYPDEERGSFKLASEYHGYMGEPADPYLSVDRILQIHGARPDWTKIATERIFPEYFFVDGKSNKALYSKAVDRYIEENDVQLSAPDLSSTQALGLQSNVIASLPNYYILPAITDYSSEIDKRQKTSTFRRLMAELSDRILQTDARYAEISQALDTLRSLLNAGEGEDRLPRLDSLRSIEDEISSSLKKVMPSVRSIGLRVEIDEIKQMFSDGVEISIDDGISTDVLSKGHGLQRTIVFSLLRTLIDIRRQNPQAGISDSSIILCIEEPELYIHPQVARLFYDVLREFSETDQVIYTTHSPNFVDASNYEEICVASKTDVASGTLLRHGKGEAFDTLDQRKLFKGFSRFNPHVNEIFFAKRILVVEGPEDAMAITATLSKLGLIVRRPEEIEWSILVAGGKEAIPFFQRVMNCFSIEYSVLHDKDINIDMPDDAAANHKKTNDSIGELAGSNPCHTFPHKLETSLGLTTHLKDQFQANQFFSDQSHITKEVEEIVRTIFGR